MRRTDTILLIMAGRPDVAERLALAAPLTAHIPRPDPALVPEAVRGDVRVIATYGSVGVTAEMIAVLPGLEMIACLGSGFEKVDLRAAAARGVLVTNCPGANASSVADHAVGLMIASIRKIAEADRFVRSGAWPAGKRAGLARGLTGRRLGILGLGAIGDKIARRAAAFEMEVGYHNRRPRAGTSWRWFDSLASLAEFADVLMISCRADDSTMGLVNADILKALGRDGHVVNIARGSVIVEADLVTALRQGVIAGAGLDVFENEPNIDEALRAFPNVVMTPHMAGSTLDAQTAMINMLMDNVTAFLAGREPPNPVAPD